MPYTRLLSKHPKLTLLGNNYISQCHKILYLLSEKFTSEIDIKSELAKVDLDPQSMLEELGLDSKQGGSFLHRGLSGDELKHVLEGGKFGRMPNRDSSFVDLAEYAETNSSQLVSYTKNVGTAYTYLKQASIFPAFAAWACCYPGLLTVDLAYFAKLNRTIFVKSFESREPGMENLDPRRHELMEKIDSQQEVCVIPRLHGIDLRSDSGYITKACILATAGWLEKIAPTLLRPKVLMLDDNGQIVFHNPEVSIYPINLQAIYPSAEKFIEENSQKAQNDIMIKPNTRLLSVSDITHDLLEFIIQKGRYSPVGDENCNFQLQLNSVPKDLEVGQATDYIIDTYQQHLDKLPSANNITRLSSR